MTIIGDIQTALGSYNVKYIARAKYEKPRNNSIEHHLYEVHVKHSADSDIETIVAALVGMSSYKTITARCTTSWPLGAMFYTRFEVEILK